MRVFEREKSLACGPCRKLRGAKPENWAYKRASRGTRPAKSSDLDGIVKCAGN